MPYVWLADEMRAEAAGLRLSTRLLIVIVILLTIGVVTISLGFFVLAAADLAGAVLFFLLWVRRR